MKYYSILYRKNLYYFELESEHVLLALIYCILYGIPINSISETQWAFMINQSNGKDSIAIQIDESQTSRVKIINLQTFSGTVRFFKGTESHVSMSFREFIRPIIQQCCLNYQDLFAIITN